MCEHEEHHRHHDGGEGCEEQHGPHGEHHRPHHRGEQCCGGHGEHHWHHGPGGEGRHGCDASGPGPAFRRRFQTREEKIARLEEYLKDLLAEARAVEERLAELKG